ncbi:BCCT family transporter [Tissierella sp.]|uniref:glycine betaine uptake BCCT transporter n=1 Tax=Tissierella sp. TaxID=41274 RepID=UPI0028617D96|nr:BCCT family transporter [Tissierella sp.]MDR7857320.1 BCCT family transporter [Tissierella sp.]
MKKKDNSVFNISLIIVLVISLWGILSPTTFGDVAGNAFTFLTDKFGWFYLISMFFFVVFMAFIAFSKYGNIRLGADDSRPEYSYISWFAMLFSAGMGIGLVFWGVAEPLNHYLYPMGMTGGTPEAANFAIFSSFLHWGIHPWANYAVIALPLAYMQFRKGKPGLISSIFIPLIGEERVKGSIGKFIDILAIFATVAGVATSLGLGVLQINSGLNYLFGIPINTLVHIIIIVVVTAMFMASAISGVDKGILFLSNANIAIAFGLMVLTLLLGPTLKIINSLTNGLGQYISGFIRESFAINAFGDNGWIAGWRIFYWAWWIAWAPFVGVFIARISKGRTIREFIIGVSVVPAIGSFIWFAIFGATGISLGTEVAAEAIKVTETAFFVVMKHIPFGSIISLVAILLLCTFFVTSADSATFVLGMMSRNGELNPDTKTKIIWGLVQSAMAFALMLAGGLQVLQTGSIVAAFPFAFVMIFACFSFWKVLKTENVGVVSQKELE